VATTVPVNVWVGGLGWFGPSYPQNGDPPGWDPQAGRVVDPGEDGPDFDELDPDDPAHQAGSDPVDDDPPPRAGKGSGTTVWADYARRHGVDVPDDADRGEIIDALDAAGVRTE
jgi:hypothetical protein